MYIVGKNRAVTDEGVVREFQGVFDSKAKAVAACRSDKYFVAPVVLNQEEPDEMCPFEHIEYPHATQ